MKTIFALATHRGKAGIGVIRVSGPLSKNVIKEVLDENVSHKIISNPRLLTRARLLDVDRHTLMDDTMSVFFKGPFSFTGEDVAEFHIHSSIAIIDSILKRLSSLEGLRMATAGEFTRRGFLNSKMDILQVEGLSDLLEAETNSQRLLALSLYDGKQGSVFGGWRTKSLKIRSSLEAYIDFGDDNDIGEEEKEVISINIRSLLQEIMQSISLLEVGEWMKNGFKIVLIGPPNAGKSSLINRLSNREISIVDEEPGTTRDILQASIEIDGKYSFQIYDTAGLSLDPTIGRVEKEGIRRAMDLALKADLIIHVEDASTTTTTTSTNHLSTTSSDEIFNNLCKKFPFKKVVRIYNKTDLLSSPFVRRKDCIYTTTTTTTATNGDGIKELKDYLINFASSKIDSHLAEVDGMPIIAKIRHGNILKEVSSLLSMCLLILDKDPIIVAEYMREVSLLLGKITGETLDHESILDEMFSSFCIGK